MESHEKLVQTVVRTWLRTASVPGYTEEDLFHEGYLAYARARETFRSDGGAQFERYATVCIQNRLRDLARKTRGGRTATSSTVDLEEVIAGEEMSEGVEIFDMLDRLKRVLRQCNGEEQAIVGLHLKGYTYAEIASKLGIDKKKVDNTIQKIKRLV